MNSTMKKIKLWLALAFSVATLCGCGAGDELTSPILPDDNGLSPIEEDNTSPVYSQTEHPAGIITEGNSVPSEEGMVRSRLTNEWVTPEVADTRPIAVIIPNESTAIPQYNLSNASILYEANVEGHMTRLMAIFEDWQDMDKIGNIRSLRTYYAYWAFEWDACILHFGGPYFIDELLGQPTTQTINGNLGTDEKAFFRTTDRKAPHNAYANGNDVAEIMERKGYELSYRGLADESHYQFAPRTTPNTLEQYADAETATYIDMSGCYPLTRCYFEYDETDGLYYRFQHLSGALDGPHTDQATGEQLSFKNLLIQNTKQEDIGEGYLALQCHDTTRDGWFFTNGKGIHVTWEKTSDYGATRYYDDNGNEITLNTGKTMVCIVEDGNNFTFR